MNSKFQITTFEGFSSQFSRVADRSILAGIDREGLKAHTAHLSREERETLARQLQGGSATYRDKAGKLCAVTVTDRP